jgi:hypothetical protein
MKTCILGLFLALSATPAFAHCGLLSRLFHHHHECSSCDAGYGDWGGDCSTGDTGCDCGPGSVGCASGNCGVSGHRHSFRHANDRDPYAVAGYGPSYHGPAAYGYPHPFANAAYGYSRPAYPIWPGYGPGFPAYAGWRGYAYANPSFTGSPGYAYPAYSARPGYGYAHPAYGAPAAYGHTAYGDRYTPIPVQPATQPKK